MALNNLISLQVCYAKSGKMSIMKKVNMKRITKAYNGAMNLHQNEKGTAVFFVVFFLTSFESSSVRDWN